MQAGLELINHGDTARMQHGQDVTEEHEKGLGAARFLQKRTQVGFAADLMLDHREGRFLFLAVGVEEAGFLDLELGDAEVGADEVAFGRLK